MKRLTRILAVLVLLGLLAIGGLVYLRDGLLKGLIETGGTEATGVATTVESVSTGLMSGSIRIEGLELANPPGFSAEPFVRLGATELAVPFSALSDDPLRVSLIEIDGLALRIERNGTDLNYEPIRERLDSLSGGDDAPTTEPPAPTEPEAAPTEPTGPAKTIVIDRVRIADWSLMLDVGRPLLQPQTYAMGEVVVENLQVTGDDAIDLAIGRILDALLDEALQQFPDLPAELGPLVDALRTGLADGFQPEDLDKLIDTATDELRTQLEQQGTELADQVKQEASEQLGAELQEQLGELGVDLGEDTKPLIDEAAKKLDGLLGGKQGGGR